MREKGSGRRVFFLRMQPYRAFILSIVLGTLPLNLSGCGYSAVRMLPPQYRTIHVEAFQNQIPITRETSERVGFIANIPQLEENVTRRVIDRFLVDGHLRITSHEDADLILSGQILDFYRQPIRRSDDETVEEYRLNLLASVELRDRDGKVLLKDPALMGDVTYFVTGPSAKSESVAVDELVTDFARRVVEWVIEFW